MRLAHIKQALLGIPAVLVGVLGRQCVSTAPSASAKAIDFSPRFLSVHMYAFRFRHLNYTCPVCS